mmetsp:Transcript_16677/g.35341  ORF Transcript_16677/g.35341 Transcript_16677/m.35341 type:complete len:113 (+) Transcript_16677:414-752(+)
MPRFPQHQALLSDGQTPPVMQSKWGGDVGAHGALVVSLTLTSPPALGAARVAVAGAAAAGAAAAGAAVAEAVAVDKAGASSGLSMITAAKAIKPPRPMSTKTPTQNGLIFQP